jgi:hypothetical protein
MLCGQQATHRIGTLIFRDFGYLILAQFAGQFAQQRHVIREHKVFQPLLPGGRQFAHFGGEENFVRIMCRGRQVGGAHGKRGLANVARAVNQYPQVRASGAIASAMMANSCSRPKKNGCGGREEWSGAEGASGGFTMTLPCTLPPTLTPPAPVATL